MSMLFPLLKDFGGRIVAIAQIIQIKIQGSEWFKERGQWQDGSFTPEAGHIIFFDWEGDGLTDHVGIVERVENGTVYTVEGNSGDACRQNSYSIGSSVIYGYGIPAY